MFSKLKEESVQIQGCQIWRGARTTNELVYKSEGKMERQANHLNEFEGQIALQENMSGQLEIKYDDNKQYSRRTSIRFMESWYQRMNLLTM